MNNYYVIGQYHNEFVTAETEKEADQWFTSHFPSEQAHEIQSISSLIGILAVLNGSTDAVNEMMLLSVEEHNEIYSKPR